jgi:hypothetical protein
MFPIRSVRRVLSVIVLSFISIIAVMPESPGQLWSQTSWRFIAGTDTGLYGISFFGTLSPLWTGGAVRKLIKGAGRWIIHSDQGVLVSEDLTRWESRNGGLPVKTIKLYRDGEKSFETVIQEIKDVEVDPADSDTMVCATKDTVYLTRDGGRSWSGLGMPTYRTNGIKAVAVVKLPGTSAEILEESDPELTVFLSHSTYGVHYIQPDRSSAKWTELNTGLEKLETTGNSDEVSDIAAAAVPGGQTPAVYASQTFRRRVYRLDWEHKRFDLVWAERNGDTASGFPEFGTVDSLDIGTETLRFVGEKRIMEIGRTDGGSAPQAEISGETSPLSFPRQRTDLRDLALSVENYGMEAACIGLWKDGYFSEADGEFISLSELWLLKEGTNSDTVTAAANREGLYMPANHAMEDRLLRPYLDLIEQRGLDMVVIDMKDDYGRLRFVPENPVLAEKGRVFRPVDIDRFLAAMKERGIYTAARIVVFKDPELAKKEKGKYAVWNGRANKPWAGYYDTRRPKGQEQEKNTAYETEILPSAEPGYEILRTYYDERWVDPYSEEVWEYIASVAEELHRRGFVEIQFDYIRFPTDGQNLGDAYYRWRENGMDMESAMLSFLRHIRSRIGAPISVDIYGANGWYRTGARTGQEVELMAPYVDVICPMYYPSHFEQDFLANSPAELRPYRIYYQGTQRTARIGRGRIIVRPYVQAFYLNVSYDRKYYNPEYVRLEAEGVRNAGTGGLTYWNNSGRYNDIPVKTLGD